MWNQYISLLVMKNKPKQVREQLSENRNNYFLNIAVELE